MRIGCGLVAVKDMWDNFGRPEHASRSVRYAESQSDNPREAESFSDFVGGEIFILLRNRP